MAAHAGTGLEDVDAGMHIADLDDLVYVHVVVTADAAEFIGKSDIHGTVGVLDDFGHLGGAGVGDDNLALAEAGVVLLHLLPYLSAVGADGAVVMQEFVDHIAGNDALGGMDKIDVLPDLEAISLNHRTDELVDSAGADSGLDDDGRPLGADIHHILDGGNHITGIDLLAELVVRGRDGHNVHVRFLIFGGELNAFCNSDSEEFVQTVLLEGGLAGVEGRNKFFIVVCADDFHTVGSHHQCCGQADVA